MHTSCAKRNLVHSSPTELSGRASGRGTSGRGTLGRGTLGRETSRSGTSRREPSGRPLPPADSPSSCCSTSTSKLSPAASASRRVGATGRGLAASLVLAAVPGFPAAVRVWNRTRWSGLGCYPENRGTQRVRGQVGTGPRFHITVPATLPPIKYLSSDRIVR